MRGVYFVGVLVFFDELLEVGAGVAEFLFAGVEDDLSGGEGTTFCVLIGNSNIFLKLPNQNRPIDYLARRVLSCWGSTNIGGEGEVMLIDFCFCGMSEL